MKSNSIIKSSYHIFKLYIDIDNYLESFSTILKDDNLMLSIKDIKIFKEKEDLHTFILYSTQEISNDWEIKPITKNEPCYERC